MPPRIQATRPYYSRFYLPRRAPVRGQAQPVTGGRGAGKAGAGTSAAGAFPDPTTGLFQTPNQEPTGSLSGDISKAIGNAILVGQQQRAANQLLNIQTPPRAGLVSAGVNPQTGQANVIPAGTPTTGTAPQTGGVGEFNMRVMQAQQQAAAQQAQLADSLKRAQLQEAWNKARGGGEGDGGGTGNASRWMKQQEGGQGSDQGGGKGGKTAEFTPGQYDINSDPRADNFGQIASDFNHQYGEKSYNKVASQIGTLAPVKDNQGNITGYTIGDPKKPAMTLTPDDARLWAARINAGRVAAGQTPYTLPSGLSVSGANSNSGAAPGTVANPYIPKTGLDVRSLPYGSIYQDPDNGRIGTKLTHEQAAKLQNQTTTNQQTTNQQTTNQQTTNQPTAANAPVAPAPGPANTPVPVQGAQPASNLAANAPQPPAEGIPVSGGAPPPIIPGMSLTGVDALSQNASLQQNPQGQLYPQQDMMT